MRTILSVDQAFAILDMIEKSQEKVETCSAEMNACLDAAADLMIWSNDLKLAAIRHAGTMRHDQMLDLLSEVDDIVARVHKACLKLAAAPSPSATLH